MRILSGITLLICGLLAHLAIALPIGFLAIAVYTTAHLDPSWPDEKIVLVISAICWPMSILATLLYGNKYTAYPTMLSRVLTGCERLRIRHSPESDPTL